MELATIVQRLWRHRILTALVVLVAVGLALLTTYYTIGSSGPQRKHSQSEFGAAQLSFYVDSRRPSLVTSTVQTPTLVARAHVVASFIDSGEIRSAVATQLGVRSTEIQVVGPFSDQPGAAQTEPVAQQRANQLISEQSPYSIFVDTDAASSTVTLFVQAPDASAAGKLAASVPAALEAYLEKLTRAARPALANAFNRARPPTNDPTRRAALKVRRTRTIDSMLAGRTVVRELGGPIAGSVRTESGKTIGVLVFLVVVVAGWLLIALLPSIPLRQRRSVGV
jgi:hypothetical protein